MLTILLVSTIIILLFVLYMCKCSENTQCNECLFKCDQNHDVCYRDCHDDDICIKHCYEKKSNCYMNCLEKPKQCYRKS